MPVHSGMSLRNVAPLCGFADHGHLMRLFKGKAGTTPARWCRSSQYDPWALRQAAHLWASRLQSPGGSPCRRENTLVRWL